MNRVAGKSDPKMPHQIEWLYCGSAAVEFLILPQQDMDSQRRYENNGRKLSPNKLEIHTIMINSQYQFFFRQFV